ncbi:MAG: 50S ribosomal protein L10 [Thermodesulfovibrionales bacterium]
MLCLWERRRLLITKEKKSRQVAELSEKLSRSKAIIITDYKGLTVAEISDLRNSLKTVGGEYKVVKNTLALRASKGTPVEKTGEFFMGTTAIAFSYEDSIGVTKKLLEFADKNEKLKIKSAIFEGAVINHQDLKAISKLPPRNVLLGMLAGTINAPVAKLACAFSAPITKFMYLLEALKNKKEQ